MFDQFRDSGWNTYYSDRPTPPEFDVTTAIISYLSVVLAEPPSSWSSSEQEAKYKLQLQI